ncbi:hypothetical protein OC861_006206 [Tilletia horrida]|nr:hypothetical protein OC861_006206 [Tilletia horrida]
MVGSFEFINTLPDVPAGAIVSPEALFNYLEPFTSHTGPKAFTVVAWIYVAVHVVFLGLVLLVLSLLIKSRLFWLFRTVNGRHGVVLVHNVVDVPLCLIVIFLMYDSIFWIISLLGYKSDFGQVNWQVLHWLRYIMLAVTGFFFMTGVAAVWPFSPATMRYPWLWNLVMAGFLPCAILATVPPMILANTAWNTAWARWKVIRDELALSPAELPVSEDIVLRAQQFLFYTSKYAYYHAIVAIILVIFCAFAALIFSVIGFRVARIVWLDIQTRKQRNRREMQMARRWSRPSLNFTDSSTTSKDPVSTASVEWASQHDPDGTRGTKRSSNSHTLVGGNDDGRTESALPLRAPSRAVKQVSEDTQRALRMHFYRTLSLFLTMWFMISALVCSGLYFTIGIYPATRDAKPDKLFGNSALKVLCIFHLVEFANITPMKRRSSEPASKSTNERKAKQIPSTPPQTQQRSAPPHGYTFTIGQGQQQQQQQQHQQNGQRQQLQPLTPPTTYDVQHRRAISSPGTPTFDLRTFSSPPATPYLDEKDEDSY